MQIFLPILYSKDDGTSSIMLLSSYCCCYYAVMMIYLLEKNRFQLQNQYMSNRTKMEDIFHTQKPQIVKTGSKIFLNVWLHVISLLYYFVQFPDFLSCHKVWNEFLQRCRRAMEALIERPLGIWAPQVSFKIIRGLCLRRKTLHHSVQITVSRQNDLKTQMETHSCTTLCICWLRLTHVHGQLTKSASHRDLLYIRALKLPQSCRTPAKPTYRCAHTHTNMHTVNAHTRRTQPATMALAIKNAWHCSNSF